jgi:transcriptional regulator with XRE-family HTH domain
MTEFDVDAHNQKLLADVHPYSQLQLRAGTATPEALCLWRESLGFSQAQIARLTGYSKTLISQMERGREPVTEKAAERFRQLAEKLEAGLFDRKYHPTRFPIVVEIDQPYVETDRVKARAKSWRKCLQCPRKFLATSTRQKYCSDYCKDKHSWRWRGKQDPADQKPRARHVDPGAVAARCPECGHVFRQKGNLVFDDTTTRHGRRPPGPLRLMGPDPSRYSLPGVARSVPFFLRGYPPETLARLR